MTPKLAYCTTRDAARRLGVSLRTAQLWVDSGILDAWRTDGGHRRIKIDSVERLLNNKAQGTQKTDVPTGAHFSATEPLRILVAEDDNALLRLYKLRLESWRLPLRVSTAANGYEAVLLVGRESPDLMIADLRMPGVDGLKMLRALSSSSYREGMEIIIVTGLDADSIATLGELPHGIRVFHRPVPFTELRELVELMIARRAAL